MKPIRLITTAMVLLAAASGAGCSSDGDVIAHDGTSGTGGFAGSGTGGSAGTGGAAGTGGSAGGGTGGSAGGSGGTTGGGGTGGSGASAGSGGAAGTGGTAGTSGAAGTAGSGGSSGAGGAAGGTRLVVASKAAGVTVWDDADKISSNVPASFVLSDSSVTSGATALAATSRQLFVGTTSASGRLLVFDSAYTMSASTSPAVSIPDANFVTPMTNGIDSLYVGGRIPMLWMSNFYFGAQWFPDVVSLSASSTTKANLTHPFQQTPAVAYDEASDRAFVGQISGAGILAWDSVSGLTGTPAASFTAYDEMAAWTMQVQGDRLYAGGMYKSGATPVHAVTVWNNASTFSSSRAPDVTLSNASGIVTSFIPYLTVTQGDVLIVVLQQNKVLGWTNASALAAETSPSFTLTAGLDETKKAVVDSMGRLYILDKTGIAIYSGFPASLSFVVKLTGVASGSDIAVIE